MRPSRPTRHSHPGSAKSNWAQVDVVLQRRADLIPNLVATVKGFAAHEETFSRHRQCPPNLNGAKTPTERLPPTAIRRPPRPPFGHQRKLSPAEIQRKFPSPPRRARRHENRIAVQRKRYNDSIQAYNSYIRQFPIAFPPGRLDSNLIMLTSRPPHIARGSQSRFSSRQAIFKGDS